MKLFIVTVYLIASVCLVGLSREPSPSQKIDQLVEAALKKQGIKPNQEITDEVFIRRAYLNIAGRVPTIEEAEMFHADTYSNKRERLIDELINSEAHFSHAFHFWADLLRMNGRSNKGALGDAYELWLKEAIRSNMPYDEMVYSLVTADGKLWENGAIGYYFRDRGMPLDNMSNTVRVFLGTRLECAQCHNHPFDKWTQMDYFKMASFSFGMNTRNYQAPNRDMAAKYFRDSVKRAYLVKAKELTGLDAFPYFTQKTLASYVRKFPETSPPRKGKSKRKRKVLTHESFGMTKSEFVSVANQCIEVGEGAKLGKGDPVKQVMSELYDPLKYLSVTEGSKNAKLPHDYQYSDADPHDEIAAETMFGDDIDLSLSDSKIEAYGQWMTSPRNPTFTKVIVNRLWKEVFGLGIFEPVDELTDHTFVSNPELLSFLEGLMKELDYDQRAFQQVLYNTKTYQRASFEEEVLMGAPYYFQGPILRRMSAEQIWDSLVALALPEADRYQPKITGMLKSIDRVKKIYQSLEERPFDEYLAMIEELAPLIAQQKQNDNEAREKIAAARESGDREAFLALRRDFGNTKKDVYKKIDEVAYVHLKEKVDPNELLLAIGVMDVRFDELDDGEIEDGREILTRLPKEKLELVPVSRDDKKSSRAKRERGAQRRQQSMDYGVYRKLISGMARASELKSPAPRGHFLRDFGQSDREVIENASDHASVPQALNLLNGPIVESLTNRYSAFGRRIHTAGTPDEKARLIFQAMLSRPPSETELEVVKSEVERRGEASYEGVVWALLNTQQFMFIQ